jgi:8-oxo-dGTP pyrophosphatase MutT (NUDIX family)
MAARIETSAGGVVFRRNGRSLEVALGEQRDRLTGARTTRLPKGKIDPGETPEQAALREVREETGLAARVVGSLGSVAYAYRERGRQVDKRVHFFLMELAAEEVGETDGELERIRWESLAGARVRLSFETEREVLRRAEAQLVGGAGPGTS